MLLLLVRMKTTSAEYQTEILCGSIAGAAVCRIASFMERDSAFFLLEASLSLSFFVAPFHNAAARLLQAVVAAVQPLSHPRSRDLSLSFPPSL